MPFVLPKMAICPQNVKSTSIAQKVATATDGKHFVINGTVLSDHAHAPPIGNAKE
jgi:hypothetical protein